MTENSDPKSSILRRIATGLGRQKDDHGSKPETNEFNSNRFVRQFTDVDNNELSGVFAEELAKVDGVCTYVRNREEIEYKLQEIIYRNNIEKYVISSTPFINSLGIDEILNKRGVIRINPTDKTEIAKADIGITSAKYALAETGTIVIGSDELCSRSVSLLPPVHIAFIKEDRILADIHHLFNDLRRENDSITEVSSCLTFITGPSRTADIELNLTLGVHGPGKLFVFMVK